MKNELNINKNPILLKADGENEECHNKMLRLMSALCCLGIFGSIICMFTIAAALLSGKSGILNVKPLAAAIIVLFVSIAGAAALSLLNKKSKSNFNASEKKLLANAVCIDGKIVGVVKHIRHVTYAHEIFNEITWNFKIEYFNNEKNCICTVESDRYLNDISNVLADDSVKVYIKPNGTLAFDGYRLRKSFEDDYITLKIDEDITDTEV